MSRYDPRLDQGMPAEFMEHLAEDSEVRLEPGYNQDEFYDDQFERRAHEIQRTPGGTTSVSVVSQKQGAWSGNNQLGSERLFAPDDNQRQTILKLDEWGMPEAWTVMLGLDYDRIRTPIASFVIGCEAVIGSGGTTQEVALDWKNGQLFSAPMNALSIIANYEFNAIDQFPPDLRLRVTLGRKKATNALPTKTVIVDVLPGTTSPEIQIPAFARSVALVGGSGAAPVGSLYDPANGLVINFLNTINASQLLSFGTHGVPLVEGARSLNFINGTAFALRVGIIFYLGL